MYDAEQNGQITKMKQSQQKLQTPVLLQKTKSRLTNLLNSPNLHLLPQPYQTYIQTLQKQLSLHANQSPYINNAYNNIIQTFEKALSPQLDYYRFQIEQNDKVLYPIVGIVAFCNEDKVPVVDCKLVMWIESLGTRCVPIPQKGLQPEQLKKSLKKHLIAINALVIPQYKVQSSIQFLQTIISVVKELIAENNKIVILSFGNSSNVQLKKYKNQLDNKKSQKFLNKKQKQSYKVMTHASNHLLQSLQLSTILQIQTLQPFTPIFFPCILSLQQLSPQLNCQSYITNILQSQTKQYPICINEKINDNSFVYHLFFNTYQLRSQVWIKYCHGIGIGLVGIIRKQGQQFKQPNKYIAHYSLVCKQGLDKAYYKITQPHKN